MKDRDDFNHGLAGRIYIKAALIKKDYSKYKYIYFMFIPVLAFYVIFHYVPLFGSVIAFKDYSPRLGIWQSKWAGFKYFKAFFDSVYFSRTLRNTLLISFYDMVFGFPVPIILALLLNEVRLTPVKRIVQTISYLPHFISIVIVCGLIRDFFSLEGIVNTVTGYFDITPSNFLNNPGAFRPIFVGSNIWQSFGWNSIIYLAALTSIDPQLYEAATIDGAGHWKQTLFITIPGILPTAVTLLILRIGNVMSVGFEKIILLYNPMTYETAEVISTFVYKKGLLEMNYSYSTAVGLFNAAINCFMLVMANKLSRKINDTSIW
jgi:putative aldouronate transport system permease protein